MAQINSFLFFWYIADEVTALFQCRLMTTARWRRCTICNRNLNFTLATISKLAWCYWLIFSFWNLNSVVIASRIAKELTALIHRRFVTTVRRRWCTTSHRNHNFAITAMAIRTRCYRFTLTFRNDNSVVIAFLCANEITTLFQLRFVMAIRWRPCAISDCNMHFAIVTESVLTRCYCLAFTFWNEYPVVIATIIAN